MISNIAGIVRTLCQKGNTRYYKHMPESGSFNPMDEDWDILIILDACRPDILSEVSEWNVKTRRSPGANSWEFVEAVYANRL